MFNPISTYRIQFHSGFTLKNLEQIIPYIQRLGIITIYASPIFEAVPGSMHGYDVVNPGKINPELGSLKDLLRVSKKLKSAGINWIQDIVPNHMGFHHSNPWLMDVLKYGEKSRYRNHFDILSEDLSKEPLMAPFLGADLDEVIGNGELVLEKHSDGYVLSYHGSIWPLQENTDITASIAEILAGQYYRLCNYRESHERMNYRRFFTVNSLICLNIQHQQAFDDYHSLTKKLIDEGVFDGIRIDHVDGLYDPTNYLYQLRELCGQDVYIVVEKILESGEVLPDHWPIQGTTGYDFLGLVNQVFTNEKAEKKFSKFYQSIGKSTSPVNLQIERKKREFLNAYMKGELENLVQLFISCTSQQLDNRSVSIYRGLIADFLVKCPVYRFYQIDDLNNQEREAMDSIFESIGGDAELQSQVGLLKSVFYAQDRNFFLRMMQFTGPLMAKGVEDTLMYTYNRFIGNNEVGDSPDIFGITTAEFHERILERQQRWPLAMNASATHDTKRGEDARARLNVLTGLKGEWTSLVNTWQQLNQDLKYKGMPDQNDEYFIYQQLIATYPEELTEQDGYQERFLKYIEKALREAKSRSSWESPDLRYEQACKTFICGLLDQRTEFWNSFTAFSGRVNDAGKINSIAAMVLKHTCPGIPDTYQGSELWDLSMVDPDNRRPVDYTSRLDLLDEIEKEVLELPELWRTSSSGKIKLYFLQELLAFRKSHPNLFAKGVYLPLEVTGKCASQLIAYARRFQQDWLVVIVPINYQPVVREGQTSVLAEDWGDTTVFLPAGIPDSYTDQLHQQQGKTNGELHVGELFQEFPVAILHFETPESARGAGILMHISSLPSPYGIGDFGAEAQRFVSSLVAAGQKYWQVLPMNPLTDQQSYSPYSATSVMAGNPLLISPDELLDEGLLAEDELKGCRRKTKRKVSFKKVEQIKSELLSKAFKRFSALQDSSLLKTAYREFCLTQADWLDQFAVYQSQKLKNPDLAWFDWTGEMTSEHPQVKWEQFEFFRQWGKLKQFANAQGIKLIGDIPFYAALDSADVWSNQHLFNISDQGDVLGAAGVPPDYFNEDGQLWGMPVYNWPEMAKDGYQWWRKRIAKNIQMYDLIRLDHFRAFSEYWEVPQGKETAKEGAWKKGPGNDFFDALVNNFGTLPVIAEDLGEISPDVFSLRDRYQLPGMKVMQFAFGEDMAQSIHAPHNFKNQNCIAYTGTHDNNTSIGWFEQDADQATKDRLEDYTSKKINKKNVAEILIRMAYASVAGIVIVPIQDILSKDAKDRMNVPASPEGNWLWRLKSQEFGSKEQHFLQSLTKLFSR